MDEYNIIEVSFRTRNTCIVKVPKAYKKKEKIREFIIDKIVDEELDNWVQTWIDFEIEEFKTDID